MVNQSVVTRELLEAHFEQCKRANQHPKLYLSPHQCRYIESVFGVDPTTFEGVEILVTKASDPAPSSEPVFLPASPPESPTES